MVKNKREFDFTRDRGFVLKRSDENITEEKCRVHFEDDDKLVCPGKNCRFSFIVPKATGKGSHQSREKNIMEKNVFPL